MGKRLLIRIGQIAGGVAFDLVVLAIAITTNRLASPHGWLQALILVWSIPPLLVGFGVGAALGEGAAAWLGKALRGWATADSGDLVGISTGTQG